MIINPILRGMNPDPSACTDGKDYFIATSTFEWFPGIKIYKSEDLSNWKLIARPLKEQQIDLTGVPDSAGVWAPCLRFYDNKFWLLYSVMHNINGIYKDLKNYIITAEDIEGEWSAPIYIGSRGFDPSIFKDDDGKFYVLSQNWDYRRTYTHQAFNGIILQEYSPKLKKVIGPLKKIFNGSPQGGTEGPSLIKRKSFYYLLVAEGGSGRHHAITVARSKKIDGPYELSPEVTLLTSFNHEKNVLQKAGHGNIIFTKSGNAYLVHLVSRYTPETKVSNLGRETAIELVEWKNDWPYLVTNDKQPMLTINNLPKQKFNNNYQTNFKQELDLAWSSLRHRNKSMSINEDGLKVFGDESLSSLMSQSLLARSWNDFQFKVQTELSFNPKTFRNQAGLTLYYNTQNWIFLYVSFDENSNRRIINIQISKNGEVSEPLNGLYIYLPSSGRIGLSFTVNNGETTASYQLKEGWKSIGNTMDITFLSDEDVAGWGFTGAMVGITCVDTEMKESYAVFHNFKVLNNKMH